MTDEVLSNIVDTLVTDPLPNVLKPLMLLDLADLFAGVLRSNR